MIIMSDLTLMRLKKPAQDSSSVRTPLRYSSVQQRLARRRKRHEREETQPRQTNGGAGIICTHLEKSVWFSHWNRSGGEELFNHLYRCCTWRNWRAVTPRRRTPGRGTCKIIPFYQFFCNPFSASGTQMSPFKDLFSLIKLSLCSTPSVTAFSRM